MLSPLSPGSLDPAVATVDIDNEVIWPGKAETASSIMYVVPSLDMWLELGPGPTPQSAPGSVPEDITDTDADSCSLELLDPTTMSTSVLFQFTSPLLFHSET